VKLKEKGASLDFLGFTFRYYDDLQGRGWRYLNVSPSEKALKKERDKLHEMTDHRQCFQPIPELIRGLNRHLKGWNNYFDFGCQRVAFGEINTYIRDRLTQHLRRRSQRTSATTSRSSDLDWCACSRLATVQLPVHACDDTFLGEPHVGKSACSVRRGEGGSHFRVALSPTLPTWRETNVMTENTIAKEIVDVAYRIHTRFGPGLLESVYHTVVAYELGRRGLRAVRQQAIPVIYENVRNPVDKEIGESLPRVLQSQTTRVRSCLSVSTSFSKSLMAASR